MTISIVATWQGVASSRHYIAARHASAASRLAVGLYQVVVVMVSVCAGGSG